MTCRERTVELVECARRGSQPAPALRLHLADCAACHERWEAELRLSSGFRRVRAAWAAAPSELCRESLMREFDRKRVRPAVPSWAWALGAAATLTIAVLAGHGLALKHQTAAVHAIRTHQIARPAVMFYEASADASALSGEDFVAVPYTPPLAAGELVRVIHTDLYPEALARLGIDIDPAWGNDIPADLVLGEDGLPRAVRIGDDTQF